MSETTQSSVQVEEIDGARTAILREPATGSEVRVVADVGSNVTVFRTRVGARVVDVLSTPDMATLRAAPTRWGSACLFPYPGRIGGAQFTFRGRQVTLPADQRDGNAIHGVVRQRAWRIAGTGADPTTGAWVRTEISTDAEQIPAREWPFPFSLALVTRLGGGVLTCQVEATNTGHEPMPMGLGFHPYFPAQLGPAGEPDDCEVWLDATELWEQRSALPTGAVEQLPQSSPLRRGVALRQIPPISSTPQGSVRNLLVRRPTTGTSDEPGGIRAGIRDRQNGVDVTLAASAGFGALVFFTPPTPPVVSLEPHTCVPNAFNLANETDQPTGMRVLEPGQTWRGWYTIAARAI